MFFRRPFFYKKFNEKILKFQGKFDKLRSRRVPSHAFVVNLVRPGTEQPQRSECSAEDKARHFFFWVLISLILKEIQNQTAKETTNVLDQTLAFFCCFCATYI